jgi:hypothetical protein
LYIRYLYVGATVGVVVAAIGAQLAMWVSVAALSFSAVCIFVSMYVQYSREVWPDDSALIVIGKMANNFDDLGIQEIGCDAIYCKLLIASANTSDEPGLPEQLDYGVIINRVYTALKDFPHSTTLARNGLAVFAMVFAGTAMRPPNSILSRDCFGRLVESVARHATLDAEVATKGAMALGAIVDTPFENDAALVNADVQYAVATVAKTWHHYLKALDQKEAITWCMWALLNFLSAELKAGVEAAPSTRALMGVNAAELIRKSLVDLGTDAYSVQLAVLMCSVMVRNDQSFLKSMADECFVVTLQDIVVRYQGNDRIRLPATQLLGALRTIRATDDY